MSERLLDECAGHDYVRFTWSDIHGNGRCKCVPARHLPKYVKSGIACWEGTVMSGPNTEVPATFPCGLGNSPVIPQPGTFHSLPWVTAGKRKVGQFLCEPYTVDGDREQGASTRTIARRQLERLAERGLSFYSGYEMEFMLLHSDTQKPITSKPSFATSQALANVESFVYNAEEMLASIGVDVETLNTEYSPGQLELVLSPSYGIGSADSAFLFKQCVRELAAKESLLATFMSMPFPGLGNGLHFSSSVCAADGSNVFYDSKQPDNLSEFAKHWLAGIVHHIPGLSALCSPTVNCYRRYHSNTWCPDACNWGLDDRSASIRVKNNGQSGTYMENRLGGGHANPYLIMAGTIAAGLDGVINKMQCPPATAADKDTNKLPSSLEESLNKLKADSVLCEQMGSEFIEWFCAEKQQVELNMFQDWSILDNIQNERDMYLGTIKKKKMHNWFAYLPHDI